MTNQSGSTDAGQDRTRQALVELVEALDRRVPHVERSSELHIATEAAQLRAQAIRRIAEPESTAGRQELAADAAGAVMTDDGGPAPGE